MTTYATRWLVSCPCCRAEATGRDYKPRIVVGRGRWVRARFYVKGKAFPLRPWDWGDEEVIVSFGEGYLLLKRPPTYAGQQLGFYAGHPELGDILGTIPRGWRRIDDICQRHCQEIVLLWALVPHLPVYSEHGIAISDTEIRERYNGKSLITPLETPHFMSRAEVVSYQLGQRKQLEDRARRLHLCCVCQRRAGRSPRVKTCSNKCRMEWSRRGQSLRAGKPWGINRVKLASVT